MLPKELKIENIPYIFFKYKIIFFCYEKLIICQLWCNGAWTRIHLIESRAQQTVDHLGPQSRSDRPINAEPRRRCFAYRWAIFFPSLVNKREKKKKMNNTKQKWNCKISTCRLYMCVAQGSLDRLNSGHNCMALYAWRNKTHFFMLYV